MEALAKSIGAAVIFVVIIMFMGALFAYPTKWLVNYVFSPGAIQSVLGTPQIGVLKAWGLSAICSSLFKGASSK